MPARCYRHGTGTQEDPMYSCNNCGGLVCVEHGFRDNQSQNCWGDYCLPLLSAQILNTTASTLRSDINFAEFREIARSQISDINRLRQAISNYEDDPMLGLAALLEEIAQFLISVSSSGNPTS